MPARLWYKFEFMVSVPPGERPSSGGAWRDTQALLQTCLAIETAHARYYGVLAAAHAADPEISALWRKTAREEESHAAQFRLAISGAAGTISAVASPLSEATRLLQGVELALARTQAEAPSIPDALRSAIRMEEALAALHMDQVVIFERLSHQNLFRAMMAADKGHVDALRQALARYEARHPR